MIIFLKVLNVIKVTTEDRESRSYQFSRDTIEARFVTLVDSDGIKDSYNQLNANHNSYLELISYDSLKNEYNCRFDVTFIGTELKNIRYPDTINIKGTFKVAGRVQ